MLHQLLLLSALFALAYAKCDPGWTQYEKKCYLVAKGSINHPQAQANCTAQGGNLLSVHNAEENNFVKELLNMLMEETGTGGNFHIGMMFSRTSPDATGPVTSAVWMDGSPVDYGNPAEPGFKPGSDCWSDGKWRRGEAEPNGDGLDGRGVELCVMVPQNPKVNGEWGDVNCSTLGGMICNKKAQP